MEKSIKLLIAGLLFSSVSVAQIADSIQHYGRGISFNKKEATTAGGVATSERLSHRTSTVASNSLFGLIPGLQVLQNAGNEWENGATLYIRGLGTTNEKSPLILIDGFERSIDNLAVQDIESVTVLKDATSLALYGIRGANGVVYITTKRGYVGKPVITLDYEFKMGTPHRLPKFVDGYTYAQALNEGLKNDGLSPRYTDRELDAFKNQTYPEFYPNVDWMDEALRDHSYGNNVNFSMRGGGDNVQYFAQLNYLNDKGILQPTDDNDGYSTQFKYSKLNFLTNLDVKLGATSKLELSLRGNFAEDNRPYTATTDIFNALYQVPAGAMPIKTSHGTWGATSIYGNNPIARISGTGYERGQSRNLYADVKFVQKLDFIAKGLSATARIGLDNEARYWERNQRKFASEEATMGWDGEKDQYKKLTDETPLDFTSSIKDVVRHLNINVQVNYDRNWGTDHKLNATLFYAMDKMTKRGQNAGRAYMDIVGQAHYTYKSRYLLDFSLSGSASSVLDPDKRWGIFPAIGAGWILSEESALKADWLDMLKLRASYGIAGRADFGTQLFRSSYSGGSSYFFGDTPTSIGGLKESRLAVDGLTYEKSHKLNAGFDFMAWRRLSVTIDGYYDHRTDILVDGDGALSSVLGIATPSINNGIVNSYGVEVAASWNDKIGNVYYQLGGQFSFNRNEIKEMNEVYRPYDYLKRTGHSIGQYFGYEVEGIYKSQQEIDEREVKQVLDEVQPGDLKFKDQNGDKIIDAYDQVALGYNNICPEIYYGFNLGAEYKGFGFTALFQGVANYSQLLDTRSIYRPLVSNNTISQHYYDNRWTASNPDGKYPRLTYNGSKNNYNTNSMWVADASFLKLRTLEVYYQLPERWIKSLPGVSQARVFARGHDLFSIDKMDGVIDPELTGASHPLMSQYTFGVNLRF
ncbi:SusC/RagA family TonB-linked outer membrane protein [Bacteroides sp. GM023]|uniref:SusC/RagA family TonB-linked outer membrane protein n=1 Tax=Bacteroides sp. GM023 TaxID=2723058 RepID=UPI00168B12F0|nr:SusC/RagA family TonB-linked outer membrane protein [Bacteroides sp. GM023]MBD3588853.1 SusC/RagA family TonB-linked outer membrane protein [Bacteroides sp. GM023]